MRAINITTILLLFQSFLANDGMAQAKELNVGDKVPEHLMKIVNSNSGEAKPTIINFWATWCVPCISELKLLDSVLNETDEINILSVTYEDEKTIKAFLEQNKDLKSGALSIISSDTLFKNYFPHRTLPHNVWIDPQNKVQNITGGDEMTRENIQSFSARAIIETQEKIDILDFDPSKPFHLSDSRFVTRSILTDRISGILTGITVSRSGFADKK
ncbi:MAG: TlpA family protein disulfide reductase [Sphingobacterium sp.]